MSTDKQTSEADKKEIRRKSKARRKDIKKMKRLLSAAGYRPPRGQGRA